MPTSADLEVEGTVHFVLLSPENRGQVLRHLEKKVESQLLDNVDY